MEQFNVFIAFVGQDSAEFTNVLVGVREVQRTEV